MRKLSILFFLILLISCNKADPEMKDEEQFLTITDFSTTRWTYIDLEDGHVVGTSDVNSEQEDELWRTRTDWDIAICGNDIRTNSGTSGMGEGGIVELEQNTYDTILSPWSGPFEIDQYKN